MPATGAVTAFNTALTGTSVGAAVGALFAKIVTRAKAAAAAQIDGIGQLFSNIASGATTAGAAMSRFIAAAAAGSRCRSCWRCSAGVEHLLDRRGRSQHRLEETKDIMSELNKELREQGIGVETTNAGWSALSTRRTAPTPLSTSSAQA